MELHVPPSLNGGISREDGLCVMGKKSLVHKHQYYDLKIAKITERRGKRLILECMIDDKEMIDVEDGAEFVTVFIPRIVTYDVLIPPVGD